MKCKKPSLRWNSNKTSKITIEYGDPRNTTLIIVLPENKNSGEVTWKRKNIRVGQYNNLKRSLSGWFKQLRLRLNNLPINRTNLKKSSQLCIKA